MEYKVYYQTKKGMCVTKNEVREIVKRIKELVENYQDIVDYYHTGECDDYNINFNGTNENKEGTFTFYSNYTDDKEKLKKKVIDSLDSTDKYDKHIIKMNGVMKFNYVTTDRKMYDLIVKKALMIAQKVTNDKFEIDDDGESNGTDPEGWRTMIKNGI